MTLQASGAIKLSEIQTEFGGTNPISLSEYYGAASGVPASGVISITDFYGTSAGTVEVSDGTIADYQVGSAATASLAINSDGTLTDNAYSSYADTQWWSAAPDAGIGSNYEARITNITGPTPTGWVSGTWYSLSAGKTISVGRFITGVTTVSLTLEIRDTATSTTQDTAALTFDAERA
jgi:hypothetical protein